MGDFLRQLKRRGLNAVQLVISDKCLGLTESLARFFPDRSSNPWCLKALYRRGRGGRVRGCLGRRRMRKLFLTELSVKITVILHCAKEG